MQTSRQRMTLLAVLYVSQAIPVGFFVIALPSILRDAGAGLTTISLFSALALAWVVKFSWAPLVDRYGSKTRGHFRSWILPLQMLAVVSVAILATTDPAASLWPLALAGTVFMLVAATQDIATDGLAVRILSEGERGPGNGIQVGGFYLGQVLGGGLVLVLVDRFGWSVAMVAMAAMMALPLLFVWRYDEPEAPSAARAQAIGFGALGRFFRRPGVWGWVALLLVYRAGDAAAVRMLGPLLVDRGLNLGTIGLLTGVVASAGALLGALAGGTLVNRLGRRESLFIFGVIHAFALLGYLAPAVGPVGSLSLYAVVIAAAFSGGLATAAVYTAMMDRSGVASSATDFTLQQSLCAMGPMVASILSGAIAARWGYVTLFGICVLVAVVAAGLAARRALESSAIPAVEPVPSNEPPSGIGRPG